jgi:hypothetical protein
LRRNRPLCNVANFARVLGIEPARIGFTDAARAEAKAHDAWLVDLATLDRDFRHYCGTVGTIAPQANKWVTR